MTADEREMLLETPAVQELLREERAATAGRTAEAVLQSVVRAYGADWRRTASALSQRAWNPDGVVAAVLAVEGSAPPRPVSALVHGPAGTGGASLASSCAKDIASGVPVQGEGLSPERLERIKRARAITVRVASEEPGRAQAIMGLYGSLAANCDVPALLAEVERLRALNESLAERVAGQSELLSRRAEGTPRARTP